MTTPTYEHRLRPGQPNVVEVRRVARRQHRPRGRDQRPWKLYLETNSEADARRILSMLYHQEPRRMVYE